MKLCAVYYDCIIPRSMDILCEPWGKKRENLFPFRKKEMTSLNLKKNESDSEKNMFSVCTIDVHSFPILSTPMFMQTIKFTFFSTYKSLVFTYPYCNRNKCKWRFNTKVNIFNEIGINHRCYNFQDISIWTM